MSLKATHKMKESILEGLIQDGKGLSGLDSAVNLAQVEWQEHVNALHMAIKQLTLKIDKECSNLNAKDSSHHELQKAEKDKWALVSQISMC